jgi:hypothetical protein
MLMRPIGDFVDELRPLVNGVMPDLLLRATLRSATRFCSDTNLFIINTTVSQVISGQTIIVKDQWAIDGTAIDEMAFSDAILIIADGERLFLGDAYVESSKGALTILGDHDSVTITASVKPDRNATKLPEALYEDWLDAVLSGAAANLYTLPENSDGSAYQYYEREYIEHMRQAKRWRLESLPHQPFSPTVRQREFY